MRQHDRGRFKWWAAVGHDYLGRQEKFAKAHAAGLNNRAGDNEAAEKKAAKLRAMMLFLRRQIALKR